MKPSSLFTTSSVAGRFSLRWWHLAAFLIMIVLTVIPYFGVWTFGFLDYDDDMHILKNAQLLSGNIASFWRAPYYGLYIPVVYTAWTLLTALSSGPSATLLHSVNLLVHMANGMIVYGIIWRQLSPPPGAQSDAPAVTPVSAGAAALTGALFFLLHPLQVETVAWVSGFRDLIGAFFTLVALMLSLNRTRPWVALAVFVLAILAKPTECFLPAALLFFHLWCHRVPLFGALRSLALWFVASAALVIAEQSVQMEGFDPAITAQPFYYRLYVAADSLGFYVLKTLWPWPLAADYGRHPEHLPQDAPLFVLLTLAVVLLVCVLRRRLPPFCRSGLLFSALALITVSGIVPFAHQRISTVADRYAYLPLAGLVIAMAPLMARIKHRYLLGISGALLAVLATLAHLRLPVWQDNRAFFGDMVRQNPASFNAHIGLGVAALGQNDSAAALVSFEQACRLQPHNVSALANLGIALFNLGRFHEVLSRVGPLLPGRDFVVQVPLSSREIAVMYLAVGLAQMQLGEPAQNAYQRVCIAGKLDPQNKTAEEWSGRLADAIRKAPGGSEPVCLW